MKSKFMRSVKEGGNMYRIIENDLKAWQTQQDRKPLLVRGARQIGKSYVIEKFGTQHFKNMVKINFEVDKKAFDSFNNLEPSKILQSLALSLQQEIIPGETLLFLDEIQECPQAISALRYFKERLPKLHIIAAGSLLEFALGDEEFKMPVGRVQSIYMKPCSFKEFLINSTNADLCAYLESVTLKEGIDKAVHITLLEKLREYFIVGGMPEVLNSYLNNKNFQQCQKLQATLFESYPRDFGKYKKNINIRNLESIYHYVPGAIAEKFKYSKVNPDIASRDLRPALYALIQAGLVYPVYHTSASGLPLSTTKNEKKFKLLFIDTGLAKYSSELDSEIFNDNNLVLLDRGSLAEQYVGQELLAYRENYRTSNLYYWEREKKGSAAEIDYIITIGSTIYPIEVKSGKTGRLKSIQVFLEEKNLKLGVRISEKELSLKDNILSIPLYLIDQLPRLITEIR